MKYVTSLSVTIVILVASESAFSHGDHHHEKAAPPKDSPADLRFTQIAVAYRKSVQPIFEKKCFDCHGNTTHYPWYYSVPGAKQLIDHDVKEAKQHLDFSNGYPFSGHGSPIEDLEAIREAIEKKEMPPFRYRLLHWQSALSPSERDAVIQWTRNSEKILEN